MICLIDVIFMISAFADASGCKPDYLFGVGCKLRATGLIDDMYGDIGDFGDSGGYLRQIIFQKMYFAPTNNLCDQRTSTRKNY